MVIVRITVIEGRVTPLQIKHSATAVRTNTASALGAALTDLLPQVRVRLADVIREVRSIRLARAVLPGPRIGQTVIGERPSPH